MYIYEIIRSFFQKTQLIYVTNIYFYFSNSGFLHE